MKRWRDCKTKFPRKRKTGRINLSVTVLIYDGGYHSIAFYDYDRRQWRDVTVSSYIEDMKGKWTYLPKPRKYLKLKKWED